jgi:phage host-nuclease inhibitor protein Gam
METKAEKAFDDGYDAGKETMLAEVERLTVELANAVEAVRQSVDENVKLQTQIANIPNGTVWKATANALAVQRDDLADALECVRRDLIVVDARLDVAKKESNGKEYILATFHGNIKADLDQIEYALKRDGR